MIRSLAGRVSLPHQRAALLTQDGEGGGVIRGSGGSFKNEARPRAAPGNGNGNLCAMRPTAALKVVGSAEASV